MELHDTEMIQKRLWELEKYYMRLGWKRIHRFLRISMEFCVCKVQLAPPHGNFISGVANPEIVYMLPRFQILCIDWKNPPLTLTENLLDFNEAYMGPQQPVKSFLKNGYPE